MNEEILGLWRELVNLTLKRRHVVSILILSTLLGTTTASAAVRVEVGLDKSWEFIRQDVAGAEAAHFDDSAWQAVSLPHTWNNLDGQDGGDNYYRGPAWYRRHFTPSRQLAGKSLFLKFDGAATTADVFVNGVRVGTHKGGFSGFCFDVTSLLHVGQDNILAVRVDNAATNDIAPLSADFTMFGGLYRDVRLLALDSLSISPLDYASPGVYIKPVAVTPDQAELEITTELRNANSDSESATIRYRIADRDGTTAQELRASATLKGGTSSEIVQRIVLAKPHLWNGRPDPYLYQLTVEVHDGKRLTDSVTQSFGVRSFRVDPDQGFFLNGRRYPLHGVSRHQDRLDKGWAVGPAEHEEDFRLIEELGCTAVRLAHYQHAQHFYDLCDRGGMVVWAELPLVNAISPSAAFADNARTQLTELVKQNFNHPSIICWCLFNELHSKTNWYEAPVSWDLIPELNKLVKQLDPTRLSTSAACIRPDDPLNLVTDIIGFNRYTGWYWGSPTNWPGTLDELRQKLPGRAIGISEYGAGASIQEHEVNPTKPKTEGHWHPEEYQCTVHEVAWKEMQARPWLWCTFVWNMFDFAVDNRDEGDHAGRNDKGLVTYDRKTKKDAFYWYKANWSGTPFVYITSRRFVNRTQSTTPVKIYSNCDIVELSINGVSQPSLRSDDHIFLWQDETLKPGRNRIDAVGISAGKQYVDSCVWSYAPPAK
jgi:beta-galactosidase